MPTLYIDEEGKTAVYEILEDEASIGRGAANAVQLRDMRANKRHAVVRKVQGRWKLIDLETKNGTRINGTYRNQHWLQHGDTLTVGQAVVRVDLAGEEAVAAPAVAVPPKAVSPKAVPPRAAPPRPVMPKAVAPKAVAPKAVARAVAPKAAAPRAATRAPARGGARAPAREVYDDEQEGDGRMSSRYQRKDANAWVKWAIGGAVGLAVLIMLIVGFQGMGTGNRAVWEEAEKIGGPPKNDYARAIAYCERHGDKGAEDYDLIRNSVTKWTNRIRDTKLRVRNEEATKWLYENVTKKTRTPGFRPIEPYSDAEVAEKLRGFLAEYGDTFEAERILEPFVGQPYPTFNEILRNQAAGDVDVEAMLAQAKSKSDSLAAGKRYGEAIALYKNLEKTQLVMIKAELYRTLVGETGKRQAKLHLDARADFNRDLAEARGAARAGNMARARALLNAMIDLYGVESLVTEAEDALESL